MEKRDETELETLNKRIEELRDLTYSLRLLVGARDVMYYGKDPWEPTELPKEDGLIYSMHGMLDMIEKYVAETIDYVTYL